MPREFTVSDNIVIDADAGALYELISNPTRMHTWSPENLGAVVRTSPTKTYAGMQFDGYNQRGRARWTTRCTVTAADIGRLFEFRVHSIGITTPLIACAIATWQYRFEPIAAGTTVTETWTDDRRGWPDFTVYLFDKIVTGGKTFADFQRGNIRKTLENMKTDIEFGPEKHLEA